jgi:site-specific DNA recombinase
VPRLRKIEKTTAENCIKNVVGYARVSTRRQAMHALSLAEQQRKIDQYCVAKNMKVTDFFVDAGLSGTTAKRPEFQRMMAFVSEPANRISAVVIYHSSRLFRDTREFLNCKRDLEKAGVKLLATEQDFPEGMDGELMMTIAAAVDQHASRRIAETTQDMMLANAENGFTNGSIPPFGYRKVVALTVGKKDRKKLEVDPDEGPIVQRIFNWYTGTADTNGPIGIKKIAERLNRENITRREKQFSTSVVESILKRTAYIGYDFYGTTDSRTREPRPENQWIKFNTPRIIDDEIFARAQTMLSERNPRRSAPQTHAGPTLLAELAKCGICNAGMMLRTGKGGQYKYLTCATAATKGRGEFACTGQSVRMDHLDGLVIKILLDEVLAPDRLSRLFEKVQGETAIRASSVKAEIVSRRASIGEATKQLNNLLDFAAEDPSLRADDAFKKRMNDIRQRRDEQTANLRVLEARLLAQVSELTPDRLAKFDERIRSLLNGTSASVRKLWVRHFVSEVIVFPNHIRILGPNDQVLRTLQFDPKHPTLGVPTFARVWRTRQDSNL